MLKVLGWPYNVNNATYVAGWGFWLTVLSLVLTSVGFYFTLVQLARTRSIAQAARDEAERIRTSLSKYDAVHEAARAVYTIGTAQRLLRSGMWNEVTQVYEDYRRAMVSLRTNAPELSDEQIEQIDAASKYIQRLCERVERDVQRGKVSIDVAKTLANMRIHDQLSFDIQQAIQRSLIS